MRWNCSLSITADGETGQQQFLLHTTQNKCLSRSLPTPCYHRHLYKPHQTSFSTGIPNEQKLLKHFHSLDKMTDTRNIKTLSNTKSCSFFDEKWKLSSPEMICFASRLRKVLALALASLKHDRRPGTVRNTTKIARVWRESRTRAPSAASPALYIHRTDTPGAQPGNKGGTAAAGAAPHRAGPALTGPPAPPPPARSRGPGPPTHRCSGGTGGSGGSSPAGTPARERGRSRGTPAPRPPVPRSPGRRSRSPRWALPPGGPAASPGPRSAPSPGAAHHQGPG